MTLKQRPPCSPATSSPRSPISARAYNRKDYAYIANFPRSPTRLGYTKAEEELLQHEFHCKLNFSRLGYNSSSSSSVEPSSLESLADHAPGSSNPELSSTDGDEKLDPDRLSRMSRADLDLDSLSRLKHQLSSIKAEFHPKSKHQHLTPPKAESDPDSFSPPKPRLLPDSDSLSQAEPRLHNTEAEFDPNSLSQAEPRLHNTEAEFDPDSLSQMKHRLEVEFCCSAGLSQMKRELHNTEAELDPDSLSWTRHHWRNATKAEFESGSLSCGGHQLPNTEVGFGPDSLSRMQHTCLLDSNPESLSQTRHRLLTGDAELGIDHPSPGQHKLDGSMQGIDADTLMQMWYTMRDTRAEAGIQIDVLQMDRESHAPSGVESDLASTVLQAHLVLLHSSEEAKPDAGNSEGLPSEVHREHDAKSSSEDHHHYNDAVEKIVIEHKALVPEFGRWDREASNCSTKESYTAVFDRARELKRCAKLPKQPSTAHEPKLVEKGWTFPSQETCQIMKHRLTLADLLLHARSHRRKSPISPWKVCFVGAMTNE